MDFSEYMQIQYEIGYQQGVKGIPYSGKTFYGYYGWLDGKKNRKAS